MPRKKADCARVCAGPIGPADFAERYHAWRGGSIGPAHTLAQSAFFRGKNVSSKVKGLYYANARNGRGAGIVEAFDLGGDIFAAEKGRLRPSGRWAIRAAAPGVVALRKVGRPEGVANGAVAVESIVALGITNQRETTVVRDALVTSVACRAGSSPSPSAPS